MTAEPVDATDADEGAEEEEEAVRVLIASWTAETVTQMMLQELATAH